MYIEFAAATERKRTIEILVNRKKWILHLHPGCVRVSRWITGTSHSKLHIRVWVLFNFTFLFTIDACPIRMYVFVDGDIVFLIFLHLFDGRVVDEVFGCCARLYTQDINHFNVRRISVESHLDPGIKWGWICSRRHDFVWTFNLFTIFFLITIARIT